MFNNKIVTKYNDINQVILYFIQFNIILRKKYSLSIFRLLKKQKNLTYTEEDYSK